MTYIPIQTSSNNKFVYVPVNSLQTGQGQPVVLYQNQALKDGSGKSVILSPQVIHQANKSIMVVSKADMNSKDTTNTFTTVRIQQGVPHSNTVLKAPVPVHTPSTLKTLRNQFGQNTPGFSMHNHHDRRTGSPFTPEHHEKHKAFRKESHTSESSSIKEELDERFIKQEECEQTSLVNGTVKTESNNNPTQPTSIGTKRKLSPLTNKHVSNIQSPANTNFDENATPDNAKLKKRRGRPPAGM